MTGYEKYLMTREGFTRYIKLIKEKKIQEPSNWTDYNCPCCGYLTLTDNGKYEICRLCNWEDDGTDDPYINSAGGPNGDYTLKEARENFQKYLIMYRPDDRGKTDSPREIQAKKDMIAAYDAMLQTTDSVVIDQLWNEVYKQSNILREEVTMSIKRYDEKRRLEEAEKKSKRSRKSK